MHQAVLAVPFGAPFRQSRHMPDRNRRLTAAPGVSHTPRKPIGFPILPCRLGYNVSALTGDPTKEAYVKELGASAVVNGPEWAESARPLESQKWAGAIDTVGSKVLARVLAEMDYNGVVAAVD